MSEISSSGLGASGMGVLLAGRYRLSERIGRGGMADVYAAQDEVLARPVAVKLFRADNLTAEDQRRIDAEVRLLASLRHPGLVTVFDAGVAEGPDQHTFLVMELVPGPTLGQHLSEGPMAAGAVAGLGQQLAVALAYVHSQGVVHRDIKPANVLLDVPHGRGSQMPIKLGDFGIARLVESTRLTMDGKTIGTANYLSPEQVQGGEVTFASDIYSFGLVLIEALTGQVVFPGSGIEAAVARLHAQPVVPAQFGRGWQRLLTAMTDQVPDRRPVAQEVGDRLAALIDVDGASAPTMRLATSAETEPSVATQKIASTTSLDPVATQVISRPRRLSLWPLAAIAVAALVVLVVVVALHARQPQGSAPPPAYPAVPGQLGLDLTRLQGAVG